MSSDPTPPEEARKRLIRWFDTAMFDWWDSDDEIGSVLDALLTHPKDIGALLSVEQLRDLLEGAVEAGVISHGTLEIGPRVIDHLYEVKKGESGG